ncbi:DPY30 domain-containing protein 2 isoform X2 [Elephas maximus indicus]|uniref:DPY30 domain-containing protein 2 isoform X2 n=1 Tax=Elephas maximus indicus TaxID=99487 RepID=UPI0021166DEE|nr:DPY30 domain-containing protein 2 isoform X2 [Elephas maximus indicus]
MVLQVFEPIGWDGTPAESLHSLQVPRPHRMETGYLKRCFGNCLAQALAEVAKVRPSDPIEYLAHWLYHYRKTTKAKEESMQEKTQLKEEYDKSLQETEMAEMVKQGEYQIQQKDEKDHKCPDGVLQ